MGIEIICKGICQNCPVRELETKNLYSEGINGDEVIYNTVVCIHEEACKRLMVMYSAKLQSL